MSVHYAYKRRKKKRFETSIKIEHGNVCYVSNTLLLLDAADKILKVVYCTRLASDVLIIEK